MLSERKRVRSIKSALELSAKNRLNAVARSGGCFFWLFPVTHTTVLKTFLDSILYINATREIAALLEGVHELRRRRRIGHLHEIEERIDRHRRNRLSVAFGAFLKRTLHGLGRLPESACDVEEEPGGRLVVKLLPTVLVVGFELDRVVERQAVVHSSLAVSEPAFSHARSPDADVRISALAIACRLLADVFGEIEAELAEDARHSLLQRNGLSAA